MGLAAVIMGSESLVFEIRLFIASDGFLPAFLHHPGKSCERGEGFSPAPNCSGGAFPGSDQQGTPSHTKIVSWAQGGVGVGGPLARPSPPLCASISLWPHSNQKRAQGVPSLNTIGSMAGTQTKGVCGRFTHPHLRTIWGLSWDSATTPSGAWLRLVEGF